MTGRHPEVAILGSLVALLGASCGGPQVNAQTDGEWDPPPPSWTPSPPVSASKTRPTPQPSATVQAPPLPVESPAAPAEPPSVPPRASLAVLLQPTQVEPWLAGLAGPVQRPEALVALGLLGFSSADLAGVQGGTITTATRQLANLDQDADLEQVVQVAVAIEPPESEQGMEGGGTRTLVAFVDLAPSGFVAVGQRSYLARSCIAEGSFSLLLEPVHTSGYADAIVAWSDSPACNGNYSGETALEVLSLGRGQLESLVEHRDSWESGRTDGAEIDPLREAKLTGKVPKTVTLTEGKRVIARRRFDEPSFRYR